MNLPAAIKSANEILALATQHEKKKFIASASVMLTVEMVKISNAINAYQGEPNRETRTLEDVFERCRVLEDQCRCATNTPTPPPTPNRRPPVDRLRAGSFCSSSFLPACLCCPLLPFRVALLPPPAAPLARRLLTLTDNPGLRLGGG